MKRTSDYLNEIARQSDLFYELTDEEREALKKCLLSIYIDVKTVCDKYGLTLMLGGGSVLGAVRHKGFIPWDDDFDMMMPREDYDKLKEVFEKELSDKYNLSVPRYKNESNSLFMQISKKGTILKGLWDDSIISGVLVDIYPIEKMPNFVLCRFLKCIVLDIFRIIVLSVAEYKLRSKRLSVYSVKRNCLIYYNLRCLIGFVFSFIGKSRLYDLFDRFASNSRGMKYCTIPTGRKMSRGECLIRSTFFPVVDASFENINVDIPYDSDTYLKNLYGDYMQIPSIEKRERHFYTCVKIEE